MNTWVERDAKTGEVLLKTRTGTGPTAPTRTLRLSRSEALALAGRLVVACDQDAENVVEGVRRASSVVAKLKGLKALLEGFK